MRIFLAVSLFGRSSVSSSRRPSARRCCAQMGSRMDVAASEAELPVAPDGAQPGGAGNRGGDLRGRCRSSGAPWNRRARRWDARRSPKRLESPPGPQQKPSSHTRCASKCFTFPRMYPPGSSQTPPERAWMTVGPAIGGYPPSSSGRPRSRRNCPCDMAAPDLSIDRSPWLNTKILHPEALGPVARFIFGSLAGNEPDNSCATSSNNSRPYHSATAPL